ncbi:MAG: bifunctional adenosylcobinamide kinase/adenosylcobinamide-phosphate guanylyltransferase [Lachnospiraceae bacterium]|nr:bifunctional adenosylcobinamide kinase/adenosylcobinamide-phosphate guanylyltransferase [Lachnospiraceae bacterium]
MFFLITGASGSGKSEYAENLVCKLSKQDQITEKKYVATMEHESAEAQRRIARHRALRAGKGFKTVEAPLGFLTGSPEPEKELASCGGAVVLLECMSNLLANLMFSLGMDGEAAEEEAVRQTMRLREQCAHLVIVTNEIFSDGVLYEGEMKEYVRSLAGVNKRLAHLADGFCEIVYTIPVFLKGEELCPY